MAEQVEANTGRRPGEWLANARYFDTDAIQTLQSRGLRVLIPADKLRHRDRRAAQPPADPPAPGASLREWMRYWLKVPEILERYRKREQSVEPVFGQIKEARRLRQFLLRGEAKARALWRLDCAVHNLLKLYRTGVRFRRRPVAPDAARYEVQREEWALAGAL